MPRLITGLDAARIHANLERVREAIADAGRDPAEVEILAAVKYVALEEMGVLGEAGLTLLGENRAQELAAKATAHPEYRWHFIGQLQSRKVKSILPHVELIHSVASESALAQLARHGDPDTRILLVSPIHCPSVEDHPGPNVARRDGTFGVVEGLDEARVTHLTLQKVRAAIEAIVDGRRAAGDTNLHYLDGLTLFGPDDVGDLPDLLHPNPTGYRRIGERFAAAAFAAGGPLA